MTGFVKSSPHFFRPVKRALAACLAALLAGAVFVRAPLEMAADPAHPPNPAKSAWFLLWLQELVSHSTLGIYAAVALAVLLAALPWLPLPRRTTAVWFARPLWPVTVAALAAAAFVAALTAIGLFLRGANWALVSPF